MHLPSGLSGIGASQQGSAGVGLNTTISSTTLEIHNRPGPFASAGLLLLKPTQYTDMQGNPLSPAFALQSLNTSGLTTFEVKTSGTTYVGSFSGFTQAPSKRLNIRNDLALYGASDTRYFSLNVRNTANSNVEIEWRTDDSADLVFQSRNNNTVNPVMYLTPDGKMGVGTNNTPGDHTLYVKGSMIMEEGFVKLENNWPDYVFSEDYPLLPLDELDTYIGIHGRLPGFPSADEVAETGIAIGETERLLTEKIEELTLYVLMLKAELDVLRKAIND